MKSLILAIIIATGAAAFASSSWAAEVKKLEPHPAARAESTSQNRSVALPSPDAAQAAEASATPLARPEAGLATDGGTSTVSSKQGN